jgi:hypothetical protein
MELERATRYVFPVLVVSKSLMSRDQIFKMQSAALRYELGDDHTYEFAQGSFEWPMAAG